MTNEVFTEVNEALRQDKMIETIKKKGPLVAGFFIIAIALLFAYQSWQSSVQANNEIATDALILAIDQKPPLSPQEQIDSLSALITEDKAKKLNFIAQFLLSNLYTQTHKLTKAEIFLKAVSEPKLYADFAVIVRAYTLLDKGEYDVLSTQLTPYASPSSPFYAAALEILAFAAFAQNKNTEAEVLFRTLIEYDQAPAAMKERANQLLTLLQST